MKYKVDYTDTPSLLEIAQHNDIEILGNMEYDVNDSLFYVAKKTNEILFDTIYSTRRRFVDDTRYLNLWLSVMCKMVDYKDVLFKDCFQSSIFDNVYFGSNLFCGSKTDIEIVENRENFINEFGIDSPVKVKRPTANTLHLDHFESYKTRSRGIIIVTSIYGNDLAPCPFVSYKMMYHPNAKTFIAFFSSKIEYNKWLKGFEI